MAQQGEYSTARPLLHTSLNPCKPHSTPVSHCPTWLTSTIAADPLASMWVSRRSAAAAAAATPAVSSESPSRETELVLKCEGPVGSLYEPPWPLAKEGLGWASRGEG